MMTQEIKIISLPMPLKLGHVNCYLVDTGGGFVLIDTGGSNARRELEAALVDAGCQPGDLKLIVITHGDFDHTGNAAYLRGKYGAKIAMHPDDAGMAERGDMFWNRKKGGRLIRFLAPLLFNFGRENRFTADIPLGEGTTLAEYGFAATVLSIPGHSLGSIGVLTSTGDLLSGDLFDNTKSPVLNAIMDDLDAAQTSVAKLSQLAIHIVYPGHGKPFPMEDYSFTNRK
jgi:hydroxyacylglutathione hydrolase